MSPVTLTAPTLLRHASELTRLLLKSPQPPRVLASQFLHEKKKLTPAHKAAISSLSFHTLRVLRLAYFAATGDLAEPIRLDTALATACTAAALLLDKHDIPQAGRALPAALHALAEEVAACAGLDIEQTIGRAEGLLKMFPPFDEVAALQREGVLYSIPQWVLELWHQECRENDAWPEPATLAKSLLSPAPLTLRANTDMREAASLVKALDEAGIRARRHSRLPSAVTVDEREQLLGISLYEDGAFEIQDAGSQLIALALAPSAGWHILDACAGGGGKTLHLADLLGVDALIVAADIEPAKLNGLRKRAARCGLHGIETVVVPKEGDLAPVMGGRSFDAVVVDAPCSGFGTARRNPLIKWKLTSRTVARLAERQYDILLRNARLVAPGGVLLYATCSLLPQENEHVIRRFLAQHPEFLPDPLYPAFAASGLSDLVIDENQFMFTLRPDLLDSDGFFVARMRRE